MEVKITATDQERNHAYFVRTEVFVEEQKVPAELEIDELEDESTHFVGYVDNEPMAAARLRFAENYGKLERIAILKQYRGKSYGRDIVLAMEAEALRQGYRKAKLNAQSYAIPFYEKLGYEVISDEFMDAGIPHKTMTKKLD